MKSKTRVPTPNGADIAAMYLSILQNTDEWKSMRISNRMSDIMNKEGVGFADKSYAIALLLVGGMKLLNNTKMEDAFLYTIIQIASGIREIDKES